MAGSSGRGALLEKLKKHLAEQERLKELADTTEEGQVVPTPRGRAALLAKLRENSKRRNVGISAEDTTNKQHVTKIEAEDPHFINAVEQLTVTDRTNYKGTSGKPINVAVNYIRLHVDNNRGVYEYEVRFKPDVDARSNRYKLVTSAISLHDSKMKRIFDGGSILYLPLQLDDTTKDVDLPLPSDTTQMVRVTLIFKKKKQFSDPEVLHVYNLLFKRIMRLLLYERMGRNYYDFGRKMLIPQYRLEVLPGYAVCVEEREDGLLLSLDTQHRVLRSQTVYELMQELQNSGSNFKEVFTQHVVGAIVLTKYNNKTYRIDDIAWKLTPESLFDHRNGKKIKYVDYYRNHYDICIQDLGQPLLISKSSIFAEGQQVDNLVALVPELTYLTGLSDAMRSDYKVMKEVSVYTRVTPQQRTLALRMYLDSVNNSKECQNELAAWGLKLSGGSTELKGRIIDEQTIWFGDGATTKGADWNNVVTKHKVVGPIDLTNWIVFHTPKDTKFAQQFVDMIVRCGRCLGCIILNPQIVSLRDDRTDSYKKVCSDYLKDAIQMAVFICPTIRADRYALIKKLCSCERSIASQVILSKTLSNPSKVQTIISKIALQMNCKLGGTLWSVKFPVSGWMVIGIDAYHGGKKDSVCGFVASTNQSLTRYFSVVLFQEGEIGNHYKLAFKSALEHYYAQNGSFPKQIIIYRDGVSDGQFDHVQRFELPQFEQVLKELQCNHTTITFIIVQKRINTRIYKQVSNENVENPPAGTIIDNVITSRKYYDFYLVPQTVRQGTVNPSRYIILQNGGKLKGDHMQQFTYKLCHLYYNWSGTIRIPAPCKYADKLAGLVGQYLRKSPNAYLSEKLHYL